MYLICYRADQKHVILFIIEGAAQDNPSERLEDITHLAGLCIEVLQQNEEHHAEVSCLLNTC